MELSKLRVEYSIQVQWIRIRLSGGDISLERYIVVDFKTAFLSVSRTFSVNLDDIQVLLQLNPRKSYIYLSRACGSCQTYR